MKFVIVFTSVIFLFSCNSGDSSNTSVEEPVAKNSTAEEIFNNKCYQCHRCDMDLTGPAIKGSLERWKDKKNLFDFIRNAPEVIGKDKYAADLFKKYNQTYMTPFPELTDAEIQAILDYCDSYKPVPAGTVIVN